MLHIKIEEYNGRASVDTMELEESSVIEIEGVRFSGAILKQALNHPPSDCLFRITREKNEWGEQLTFREFRTAQECAKFFTEVQP